MKSLWNNVEKTDFNSLDGDIKTDVLVIGGGICGILCAYMLKNANIDYVLIEANKICSGITNGTTAKITTQHGLIYSKIIKKYGVEKAQMYYESQKYAFDMLLKLASGTDADFETCNSYVYSTNDISVIEKEMESLSKIGCNAKFTVHTELPFKIAGALAIENQANFHPLKFAYKISEDLKIYENTKAIKIKNGAVITDKGTITAKKLLWQRIFLL